MLSSPVILYDYPKLAPENSDDSFDAGEIEEILSLRNVNITEEEKREVRSVDKRARRNFARNGSLTDGQLLQIQAAMRRSHVPDEALLHAESGAFRGRQPVPSEDLPPA